MRLTFEPGFLAPLTAQTISTMFEAYGDFYLYKDGHDSAFLEFHYIDPEAVPERTLEAFIELVKSEP